MMNSENQNLWGEIPRKSSEPNVFENYKDLVERIKEESFDENVSSTLCETTLLTPKTKLVDPKFCAMEESVIYTIGLSKYSKYLADLCEKMENNTANMAEVRQIISQTAIPKFDEKALPKARKHRKFKDKNGISYFQQGKWHPEDEPPQIPSRNINLKLLSKSVKTILAHTGFDETFGEAASVLTMVADEYFTKVVSTLRDNTDAYYTPSLSIGFVDPMEATFQQMGIGSILAVSDYYQRVVIGQRIKVKSRIVELHENLKDLYEINNEEKVNNFLSQPRYTSSNVVHIGSMNSPGPANSMKDMTDEYRDIPELHLSTQRGENSNATLAVGLLMLESMESKEKAENRFAT